jgi:hypothetical protein
MDEGSILSHACRTSRDETVDVFEHGAARMGGKLLDLAQLTEQALVLR